MLESLSYSKKTTSNQNKKFGILEFIFLLIYFLFISYIYLYSFKIGGPKPLHYYFAFTSISVFVAIINISSPNIPKSNALKFLKYWALFYAIYLLFHGIFSPHSEISLKQFITNFEALIIFICAVYVLLILNVVRASMWVMGFGAILTIPLNIWDFIDPIFTTVPGRSAGLYENPTIAGRMIALMMVASLPIFHKKLRMIFVLLCGLAVLLTFSRAAWIFWFIGFFWMLSQSESKNRISTKSTLAFLLVLSLVTLVFTGVFGKMIVGSMFENYLTSNTMGRLGITAKVMSGHSYEERQNLVKYAIKDFAEAPLFGQGLGYTEAQRRRPHNIYLLFLSEGGLIGLLVYVLFLGALWMAAYSLGKPLVIIIAVSGLFTHNNFEQPAMMLICAFIVAHGIISRHETGKLSGK